MLYLIYDILLLLGLLFYLPVYAWRGRLHRDILSRLGFFGKVGAHGNVPLPEGRAREVVWIHAVSVGEARAAGSLIKLIRLVWPDRSVVVSCVTPAGYGLLEKILKKGEKVFYAPLDLSFVVRKFFAFLEPRLLIIMETELWPNFIHCAVSRGVPVVVANARISGKSFRKYRLVKLFMKPLLRQVSLFCAQSVEDKERLIRLGAAQAALKVTGNIKFDFELDSGGGDLAARLRAVLNGSPLFIAGSTHHPEEEIIIDVWRSLLGSFPNLALLIAPRHLQRLETIERMISLRGLKSLRVSGLGGWACGQVLLLDSVGDLSACYEAASVVFVGGSLIKKGGQNPLEPALFAKPIVFGRHMHNFKEIRDLFLENEAAVEVNGPQSLAAQLSKLLAQPQTRKALGERARSVLDKNRGAARRTFEEIKNIDGSDRVLHAK